MEHEVWQMFRVYLDQKGQHELIQRFINETPQFPFCFNQYFGAPNGEKDHIQLRFPISQRENAEAYLKTGNDLYTYELFDWKEHPATIINMQLATKIGLVFLKETGIEMRTTPMQMTEFLHYFLNILNYTYFDEEELALTIRNFWKTRRDLTREFAGSS